VAVPRLCNLVPPGKSFDRRILYNYFVAPTEGRERVSGLLATVSCQHARGGETGRRRKVNERERGERGERRERGEREER